MDKMIVDSKGEVTISNDGATILKKLDIVHPGAKTLVDIARSQDDEVSEGNDLVSYGSSCLVNICFLLCRLAMEPPLLP